MILIDNMDMPKNCKECRFMYQDTGELNNGEEVKVYMCSARSQGTAEKDYADKRSEWCPLHEVTADEDFEKQIHAMFDHIWDCEIEHPVFQDTVGDLMNAVIKCHADMRGGAV